jgi:hypothetical protein
MYLAGNHDRRAWYVGLFSQVIWGVFIWKFKAYGLLPLSVSLVFMYIRNIKRGKRLYEQLA